MLFGISIRSVSACSHSVVFLVSRKLVIGGEEVAQDSCKERDGSTEYEFSWLTSGFQPTKTGRRSDVNFTFKFENAEVVHTFQVKFYSPEKGSHITWGTEVRRLELEVKGLLPLDSTTPYQTLAPTNISCK